MDPVIRARGLRYTYPDGTPALRGVDFDLAPGERVALLGPNGSGKTTFVLHLNGLLRGDGELVVCGLPLERRNLGQVRSRVGLVFQDPDDQLFMPTVLEDVCFGPLNMGRSVAEAKEAAMECLARVGMRHAVARVPQHLSLGEKRRVAIAGVLAMSPEVLVLDEPTTFLDPPALRELTELLRSLPQAQIVVTHDAAFARAAAHRAVFFEGGLITADGSVDEVIARFRWQ